MSVVNNRNGSSSVTQDESRAIRINRERERERERGRRSRNKVAVARHRGPKSSKCKRAKRYRWMGAVSQRSKLNLLRSVIAPYLVCRLLVARHRIGKMISHFNASYASLGALPAIRASFLRIFTLMTNGWARDAPFLFEKRSRDLDFQFVTKYTSGADPSKSGR